MSFKQYYQRLFTTFGYPLTERCALSLAVLNTAAKDLRIAIPAALRDYYLVAGRERRFNLPYNRLLAPKDWEVDRHRLIFMEENQVVLWWGVSTRAASDDPPVWQGMNDEPIQWAREYGKASKWLAIMLHYQAVNGGMPYCASQIVPELSQIQLNDTWSYHGECSDVRAYSRHGQVLCLTLFWPPWENRVSIQVLAGAKTKHDLNAIENDLGVDLD